MIKYTKEYKQCLQCNKKFYKRDTYSRKYWGTARYCSPRCGSIGNHNKLGKTGQRHTLESRRRISLALKGSKGSNWQGGITSLRNQIGALFESRLWREAILVRDKYACQSCGAKECRLEVHHKKPCLVIIHENNIKTADDALKCKEFWDTTNAITLCRKCHRKTDDYGCKALNRYSSTGRFIGYNHKT